jgi:hypothetical protein
MRSAIVTMRLSSSGAFGGAIYRNTGGCAPVR